MLENLYFFVSFVEYQTTSKSAFLSRQNRENLLQRFEKICFNFNIV